MAIEALTREMEKLRQEVSTLQNSSDSAVSNLHSVILEILTKLDDLHKKQVNSYGVQSRVNKSSDRKKRVLVVGFFGARNLGDELMLESFLRNVDARKNLEVTIMLSENYSSDLSAYGAYRFIYYPTQMSELNLIALDYDAVVFAGGALIDDVNFTHNLKHGVLSLPSIIIHLALRFIAFDKKCVFYGLSSNQTLSDPNYIEKLRFVVVNSTYFSLRDKNSLETLKKSNIDTEGILLVDDLLFSHPKLSSLIKASKDAKVDKLISIIYVYNEDTFNTLSNFTGKLLKLYPQHKICLIPFYSYLDNDIKYIDKIVEKLSSKRVFSHTTYPLDLAEIINALKMSDLIISMRYHGTLLASLMGKRVISLDMPKHPHYYNKNKHLYENYGFDIKTLSFPTEVKKVISSEASKNLVIRPNLLQDVTVFRKAIHSVEKAINKL